MKIVGCDLHARQQAIARVDTETGEFAEKTLSHEGNAVREFHVALGGRVVVGIEATGAMQTIPSGAYKASFRPRRITVDVLLSGGSRRTFSPKRKRLAQGS